MRKHVTQMTTNEIEWLEMLLGRFRAQVKFSDLIPSSHFLDEQADHKEKISVSEVQECYLYGSIIEINDHGNNLRILLRKRTSPKFDTIIVLELASRCLVTCYKNEHSDLHSTLDLSQYKWTNDIRRNITYLDYQTEKTEMNNLMMGGGPIYERATT